MSPKTIVLITGANGGVGYATAKAIAVASSDYHVIICSRSLPKGEEALSSLRASPNLKGTLSLLQLELTDSSSIEAAAKAVESQFGRVDIVINNAAVYSGAQDLSLKQQYIEDWQTNVLGSLLVTEAFKPLLLKSDHGRLIFVTSGLGSISIRFDDSNPNSKVTAESYRSTKAALNMMMVGYHRELGQGTGNVKVHGVCPGLAATNLRRDKAPIPGSINPDISGQVILGVVEGKRDADIAKVVYKDGVYPW